MPSKYVRVGDVATNYLHNGPTTLPGTPPVLGPAVPVVFLHGEGSNANTWHRQLAALGPGRLGVALDFPGHGRSGGTEALSSLEAYGAFAVDFLAALDLPPVVLVGASMGGAAAVEAAIAAPERVRGAVIVGCGGRFEIAAERLATWRDVMRGRATQPFTTEGFASGTDFAVLREHWMEQVKTDPRVRYHDLAACAAWGGLTKASPLRCPALVIAGREDGLVPLTECEALAAALPDAKLAVVDRAGHFPQVEQPESFHEALEGFLSAIEAAPAIDPEGSR